MNLLARCLLVAAGVLTGVVAHAGEPVGGAYPNDEALRHYLAGRWLLEDGDLKGAESELARAVALDPSSVDILLEAAEVASRVGDAQRTLELTDRALGLDPHAARAQWLQGAALFNLSRNEEALVPLRAAVQADSDNVEYLRTLAQVAESSERVALVDSCTSRIVQLDPDDAEAWFQFATTRARLGDFATADSALTQALEGNPMRPGALFLRGWIRERLGHPEEAITLYRHHLEMHANDVATRRRLVNLLTRQDHTSEALEQARLVTAAAPDDPDSYQVEADLAFRAGHVSEGRRALARMREHAAPDADGIARSTDVLCRNGHGPEAISLADDWAGSRPGDLHGLMVQAFARSAAGLPDSAVTYARRAVEQAPDSTGLRRLLARYLRDAHRWHDAIVQSERVREQDKDDPSLLLDIGFCHDQLGEVPEAIEAGREALALAPDVPQVLNFLGYLLADHERDLGEAEQLVRRAIAAEPDNGAYIDSMGWVLYRQGQLTAARSQLERALQITGGDPVIHEHLGDVYTQLRLYDLARQQYRLSLAKDAGNPRVKSKLEATH